MNEWYYRDPQNRKIGPLSDQEFEERVIEGEVQPKTRVWRSGLTDWTTYEALLAYEESCMELASGPSANAAPWSSSFCTQIAVGVSATNRPPTRRGTVTRSATPHGTWAPSGQKCEHCREEVPSHLIREIGCRRLCGFCVQKQENDTWRANLRAAKGVDSDRLGKFLVRCALIAGALLLGRVIFFEQSHSKSPSLLPTPELPAAFTSVPPTER